MGRKKPNFLLIGVQKAGTTFLAKRLSEHPDVFFSKPKELFFFNADKVDPEDFENYLFDNFFEVKDHKLIGEGSTTYFHHPRAINFIEHYLGNRVRTLVCLRHPVERMFSHYPHDYRKGRRTGSEPLNDPIWRGYRARSHYADRLEIWQSRFPRFKALFFDDLVESGPAFYRQATDFLRIEPQEIADDPVNEGLRMIWDGDELTISREPGKNQVAPRFLREDVEACKDLFRKDVERTAEIARRDLSRWLETPDFGRIEEKFGALENEPDRVRPERPMRGRSNVAA